MQPNKTHKLLTNNVLRKFCTDNLLINICFAWMLYGRKKDINHLNTIILQSTILTSNYDMKKFLLAISIIINLFSNSLYSQIPTSGQVGYWPFSGNANDSSGNNLNGTANGAVLTEDRFGNPSSAYSFDGIDDYILVNDDDLLSFPNNEFCLSF